MTFKYMAAIAVSGILAVAAPFAMGVQPSHALELAGADEGDKATKDQLRRAGQEMVPAENLKKAEPKSEPSFQPVSQPAPAKQEQPAMEAKPAMEQKPAEPEKMAKPGEKMMAKGAEIAGPYLRADVGYGITMNPDGANTAGAFTNEDVGNLGVFGGGVGYRFNENLRADLTFSYRPDADVDATTSGGTNIASEVDGMTIMINAYADLGEFSGFTPYVGAGIGYARLETADQTGTVVNGGVSSNFAWAVMLGTAIDVGMGDATRADLGYRFINLGEFEQESSTTYDDLMVHELRAGLRHSF
ncbi:MAG: outer membrane beta-barrel protein [Magnetovibrio sp.]|nr:outer membrane beta-barrel protein [Magnetovibrio sp.]